MDIPQHSAPALPLHEGAAGPPVRVAFLTLVFSPDGVSTSTLVTALAVGLKSRGHDVRVLTSTPHYNFEPETRAEQPLRSKWGRLLFQSDCQGIPVLHASIPAKASRVGSRIFDYVRFHAITTIAGLTVLGRPDVIFAPSPPLTIGLGAWLLALRWRVPFIYNVQEIYPDVAVSLGVLRGRTVIRLLEVLEKFIYARAASVVTISERFLRKLIDKGVAPSKLLVIPNFVDTEGLQPGDRRNDFSARHQLDGRFVVLYAGNIGLTQGFETVLAAARQLEPFEDIVFVIVGDGARRSWLENELARALQRNVLLLPYQAKSVVALMYASSNVCLVPLKRGTAQDTFPSKIYTAMAAGRAVVAAADAESETTHLVQSAGCGWAVPPDDPEALAAVLRDARLRPAEADARGRCGREYVAAHNSRNAVLEQYDRLVRRLASGER